LAEQLWDSVSKKDLENSEDIKKELDVRIQNLEDGKAELYSWDEVKAYLKSM
jgi:putative addiction module component (TIGR02574 family)